MRIHQSLIVILFGFIFSVSMWHDIVVAEVQQNVDKQDEDKTKYNGIINTTGIFVSPLVDYEYVNRQDLIEEAVISEYSLSYGNLIHVPAPVSFKYMGIRSTIALSAALGLKGPDITKNLQVGIGGSVLFNSEHFLLSLTSGYMVGPVQRLNCYAVGDAYPADDAGLTKPVIRHDWFYALTFSVPIEKIVKNLLPSESTKNQDVPSTNVQTDTKPDDTIENAE
ncbi:hypothetical protein C6501_01600 [Candidatus Poribacteria bacterium]|nr:MAG: hypothetical protein C6501_01600 [Candidatus Poribacteria bacterium]